MVSVLTLSCVISTPLGPLELEDPAGGFELHRESFEETRESWRKHQVSNQWVDGTFVIGAVRENVEVPIVVWVTGATPAQLEERLARLTDAFSQLSYTVAFTESGQTQTWRCQVADLQVRREQAYRFAREALVRASVSRMPAGVLDLDFGYTDPYPPTRLEPDIIAASDEGYTIPDDSDQEVDGAGAGGGAPAGSQQDVAISLTIGPPSGSEYSTDQASSLTSWGYSWRGSRSIWWTFELAEARQIRWQVVGPAASLLGIFSAPWGRTGQPLVWDSTGGPGSGQYTRLLQPGRYWVALSPDDADALLTASLRMLVSEPAPAAPADTNSTTQNAYVLSSSSGTTAPLVAYSDWPRTFTLNSSTVRAAYWRFTSTAAGTIELSAAGRSGLVIALLDADYVVITTASNGGPLVIDRPAETYYVAVASETDEPPHGVTLTWSYPISVWSPGEHDLVPIQRTAKNDSAATAWNLFGEGKAPYAPVPSGQTYSGTTEIVTSDATWSRAHRNSGAAWWYFDVPKPYAGGPRQWYDSVFTSLGTAGDSQISVFRQVNGEGGLAEFASGDDEAGESDGRAVLQGYPSTDPGPFAVRYFVVVGMYSSGLNVVDARVNYSIQVKDF